MEKRILGVILSVLGMAGLLIAGVYFMKPGNGTGHIKPIFFYGLLGILFFLSGIGLIRSTKDKAT